MKSPFSAVLLIVALASAAEPTHCNHADASPLLDAVNRDDLPAFQAHLAASSSLGTSGPAILHMLCGGAQSEEASRCKMLALLLAKVPAAELGINVRDADAHMAPLMWLQQQYMPHEADRMRPRFKLLIEHGADCFQPDESTQRTPFEHLFRVFWMVEGFLPWATRLIFRHHDPSTPIQGMDLVDWILPRVYTPSDKAGCCEALSLGRRRTAMHRVLHAAMERTGSLPNLQEEDAAQMCNALQTTHDTAVAAMYNEAEAEAAAEAAAAAAERL